MCVPAELNNSAMAVRLAGSLSAQEEATEEVKAWACTFQQAIEKERKVEYDAFMPLSFCTQVCLALPFDSFAGVPKVLSLIFFGNLNATYSLFTKCFVLNLVPCHAQVVAGTNYFVRVSTLVCGGTRPNVNTILLLKLFQVPVR